MFTIPNSSSCVTVGGWGKLIEQTYDYFREIEAQGFVRAHFCYGEEGWVAIFVRPERAVKQGICCLCGWITEPRDTLSIRVPKGIRYLYAEAGF